MSYLSLNFVLKMIPNLFWAADAHSCKSRSFTLSLRHKFKKLMSLRYSTDQLQNPNLRLIISNNFNIYNHGDQVQSLKKLEGGSQSPVKLSRLLDRRICTFHKNYQFIDTPQLLNPRIIKLCSRIAISRINMITLQDDDQKS